MCANQAPSIALKAANEQLHHLRNKLGKGSTRQSICASLPSCSITTAKKSVCDLPAHLGWASTPLTQHLRQVNGIETKNITITVPAITGVNRSKTKDRTAVPLTNHIRHHPSIGITALNTNHVPQYRIWLACRHLDQTGSGQLSIATIKQAFTPETAVFRLCGWRRLRQILHKGNGHFWTWNHQQNRLWLFGTVRIAKNLGTQRLEGQPVWLPTKAFTNGIGHFKAHLYAAWHSSRNQQSNKVGTPISRQTQQQLTQVPQRTQRHYEKQAGVKTKTNLAVGSAYTPTNIEKHTWKKGGAIFQFVDKNGRLGKKNGRYVAWQMPNSYIGPHAVAARGNQRRVNRQLIDLVQKGAQGNNEPLKTQRRYFQNGRFAAKAISQHQIKEGYWPLPDNHRYQLWSVFFE